MKYLYGWWEMHWSSNNQKIWGATLKWKTATSTQFNKLWHFFLQFCWFYYTNLYQLILFFSLLFYYGIHSLFPFIPLLFTCFECALCLFIHLFWMCTVLIHSLVLNVHCAYSFTCSECALCLFTNFTCSECVLYLFIYLFWMCPVLIYMWRKSRYNTYCDWGRFLHGLWQNYTLQCYERKQRSVEMCGESLVQFIETEIGMNQSYNHSLICSLFVWLVQLFLINHSLICSFSPDN